MHAVKHERPGTVGGTVVSPALLYLHRSLLGYPWLLRRGMFVVFWVVPCGACASDRVSGERSDHNIVGLEALRLHRTTDNAETDLHKLTLYYSPVESLPAPCTLPLTRIAGLRRTGQLTLGPPARLGCFHQPHLHTRYSTHTAGTA